MLTVLWRAGLTDDGAEGVAGLQMACLSLSCRWLLATAMIDDWTRIDPEQSSP